MTRRKPKDPEIERRRRRKLVRMGKCILSSLTDRSKVVHGPPLPGRTKCQRCIDVHKGTDYKSAVLARLDRELVPVVSKRCRELPIPTRLPFPIRIVASFEIQGGL